MSQDNGILLLTHLADFFFQISSFRDGLVDITLFQPFVFQHIIIFLFFEFFKEEKE
jgi:hypothetical protein